jgi:hypothetical protein
MLNLFILFHLVALFSWGMPESAFRNRMAKPFEKYMLYSGLWHIWGMFAPVPLRFHFDVRAEIRFRDGSIKEWIAPRMEELPVWERAPKERYRKWRERIRSEEFAVIWGDTARYIARQMDSNPGNPPVEVKMTRYWMELPRPDMKRDYQPLTARFDPTNSFTYTTIPILPEDLK